MNLKLLKFAIDRSPVDLKRAKSVLITPVGLCLAAGLVVAVIAGLLWLGWAISVLWGWFVVPLGVPEISISQAAGIALVLGVTRFTIYPVTASAERLMVYAALPPLSVAVGWAIRWTAL